MRNISFMITTQQMYDRTKTVTRRIGWTDLQPGDLLMAVEKGMGLKRGEKVKRIYPIRILSVRKEELQAITDEDVKLEGFPDMTTADFVAMFCNSHHGCHPNTEVTRIEFEEAKL